MKTFEPSTFKSLRTIGAAAILLLAFPTEAQTYADLAQIAKSLGVITQSGSTTLGNATIIDACHVISNFHVVFSKSKDVASSRIEFFDNPQAGHKVDFSYALDINTGKLTKKTRATVIEFDNYAPGVGRGMVADKAVLRLENCVDNEFVNVVVDRPEADQRVPAGNLVALGLTFDGAKFKLLSHTKCPSDPATIVTGLFLANCGMPPGTSGSMILSSERSDGKLRMVGLVTDLKTFPDGSQATFAIYAKAINKLLDSAIESKTVPTPAQERKPRM